MEDKYIVAIEIGSSKIRGALAAIDSSGMVNVLAVQEENVYDSVRYGQVRNIEEVANTINDILRKLEKTKAIQPRVIECVYVGLSGFTVGSSDESSTMNFVQETDITAQIIKELKEKAAGSHISDKEIYEIIPVEYTINNETNSKPVGCVGNTISANYKLIEGTPVIKSNINRVIIDRLKLEGADYIVTPLAIADNALSREEKTLGCVLVDFGAETSTVVIFKGGALRSLSTLPMGSRNITRDLMTLNILEDEAENIKRTTGIISPDQNIRFADQADVSGYISARSAEIIANILAQIEYAGLKPADLPSGIIVTGGGSKLKGLNEQLAEQSKMKVRRATAPRNFRITDTSVLADDALDIISLLITAAANNPIDCLSEIIVEQTVIETPKPTHYVDELDPEFDDKPRIGHMEDEPLDDDYGFDDDFSRPAKKRSESTQTRGSKNGGIVSSIRDRIRGLSSIFGSDDMNDEFDSDEKYQ